MEKIDYESLSEVFKAISTKERILALEMFGKGKMRLTEVSKISGMSRSGFQSVVDEFRESELIEEAGHRSYYKLSPKGVKVLEMIRTFNSYLGPIEEQSKLRQLKASIAKFGAGLTEEDIKDIFREVKEGEK